jgi:parvulin-like peptidyl-prolyl isomerase
LDKKVFSMKKGEISDPIWVSEGVYILLLVDVSNELYAPLEDVKGAIMSELYKLKRERYFNEWLKTLWEKASVTINLI